MVSRPHSTAYSALIYADIYTHLCNETAYLPAGWFLFPAHDVVMWAMYRTYVRKERDNVMGLTKHQRKDPNSVRESIACKRFELNEGSSIL